MFKSSADLSNLGLHVRVFSRKTVRREVWKSFANRKNCLPAAKTDAARKSRTWPPIASAFRAISGLFAAQVDVNSRNKEAARMQNSDSMTPEERFKRIENLLEMSVEYLARHDGAMSKHDEAMAKHDEAIVRLNEAMARNEAEIEKHAAAIRDLIVVSRTVLEAAKETRASIAELRTAQKLTEEKLHVLVAKIDRIIGPEKK
jgi:hypothetical protein